MTREVPRALARAAALAESLGPDAVARLRRRMVWTLFAMAALGSTGYIAAVVVGTLVAAEIAGSAALGGLPTAVAVLGTATAATVVSAASLRIGRRRALLAGLSVGLAGALVAVGAVVAGSLVLLLAASALTGFANGSAQLGRYVAADLVPPERRASAIGTVVWGSTIGAVAGPNLVAWAGGVADSFGVPTLAGAYVVTAAFIGISVVVGATLLRPEPYALAHVPPADRAVAPADAPPLGAILARPAVLTALVALVGGQVVMVLIMTMTPLHLAAHGHGLETVGFVLSAHTFGMFALSPISGRLTDRFGSRAIIAAGLTTLAVAAALSALAPPEGGVQLTVALFLLGWGWNLGFVAASAMLTRGLDLAERTRLQGFADGLVWSSAAVASLSSGVVVAWASYAALGFAAVLLLAPPAALLAMNRARRLPV